MGLGPGKPALGGLALRALASHCDCRQRRAGRNVGSKSKGKRCGQAGSGRVVAPGCTGPDGITRAFVRGGGRARWRPQDSRLEGWEQEGL